MSVIDDQQQFLDGVVIDDAIWERWPDYRCLMIVADGVQAGPCDAAGETTLAEAERAALTVLDGRAPEELPHLAAWREAYRGFGAKPQRTRNSAEALLRRVETGLPRINRVADLYNAVSVRHALPAGGENRAAYVGSPRLCLAEGTEDFATIASGEDAVEHPSAGEVIWRDDAGVTCRRWNWRQCERTALHDDSTSLVFILDALGPLSDAELEQAGDEIVSGLGDSAAVVVSRRVFRKDA